MAEQSKFEQLDQGIEALLARPEEALPAAPAVEALLRLAAELRGLPREAFRARLKSELERKATVRTKTAGGTVAGIHTVTPYLAVREAEELIAFIKEAFEAEGNILGVGSAGGLHAEYKIEGSLLMIGGGAKWRGTPMPASLHLYVRDADAAYRRALVAGAKSLYVPMDQPYGDREAGVEDLCGNQWFIATHKATGHAPAGFAAVTPGLRAKGAGALIDYLRRAFGGEEISRSESPGGEVAHAEVRVGESVVEVGEAHGRWGPMPMMLLLHVEDVDSSFRRAVEAGAIAKSEPADQAYGARSAAVDDPFGNQWWFLAAPRGDKPKRK